MTDEARNPCAYLPMDKQINWLVGKYHEQAKKIDLLENPPETTEEEKKRQREDEKEERREAAAERVREREEALAAKSARELQHARAAAIRALVRLLPKAVKQANAGKPALLRMILRATK